MAGGWGRWKLCSLTRVEPRLPHNMAASAQSDILHGSSGLQEQVIQ